MTYLTVYVYSILLSFVLEEFRDWLAGAALGTSLHGGLLDDLRKYSIARLLCQGERKRLLTFSSSANEKGQNVVFCPLRVLSNFQ